MRARQILGAEDIAEAGLRQSAHDQVAVGALGGDEQQPHTGELSDWVGHHERYRQVVGGS